MGKRELLLIAAFVIVGAVVYQATAPPADPNANGLSLSRFLEHARREIRGNRAVADRTTTSTEVLPDGVTEVRIVDRVAELVVIGEDRADIETALQVNSRAYDDAEAQQYARETVLTTDRTASVITFGIHYPRPGRQRATLSLKVPARVRVRVESRQQKLDVRNVADVELTNGEGQLTIEKTSGRATITHRGGRVRIDDAEALKFTARGSDATVTDVRGHVSLTLEHGAEVKTSALGGPVEVEMRGGELALDRLEATRGPIRIDAVDASVTLTGVASDTRIDARGTDVDVTMSRAAPLAIYSQGRDVALTPPAADYTFDAVVTGGEITPAPTVEALGFKTSTAEIAGEARASGAVGRGGPPITVRSTGGDLVLRSPSDASK